MLIEASNLKMDIVSQQVLPCPPSLEDHALSCNLLTPWDQEKCCITYLITLGWTISAPTVNMKGKP